MRKIYVWLILNLLVVCAQAVPQWADRAGIVLSVSDLEYDGNVVWVANQQGNLQSITIDASGHILHNNYIPVSNVLSLSEDNGWLIANTGLNWNLLDVSNSSNPAIVYQSAIQPGFISAWLSYPYVIEQLQGNVLNILSITVPSQPQIVNTITISHSIRKLLCMDNHIYASCNDSLFYNIGINPDTTALTVDSLLIPAIARDMAGQNQSVWMVSTYGQLISIDARNPVQMQWDYFDTNSHTPLQIEARNNLLAVVCSGNLIDYYTISPGNLPQLQVSYMIWGANCFTLTDNFTLTGSGLFLYSVNHTDLNEADVDWVAESSPGALDIIHHNDYWIVARGAGGISIYQELETGTPTLLSTISDINASQIMVNDSLLYVADASTGLRIYDINDIQNPFQIASYSGSGGFWRIARTGRLIYGLRSSYGIRIIDVGDPANPVLAGSFALAGVQNIIIEGNIAYVTSSGSGLFTLDISNPTSPVLMDNYEMQGFAGGFCLYNHIAYVNNGNGIILVDTTDPYNLWQPYSFDPEGIGFAMDNAPLVQDNYMLFWNNYCDHIYIYEVSNPSLPVLFAVYAWNRRIKDAIWEQDKLISANEVLGFSQLNFPVPVSTEDDIQVTGSSLRAFPNPFSSSCRFELEEYSKGRLILQIFNIKGQLVREIRTTKQDNKSSTVSWDGKDTQGDTVQIGVYLARVNKNGFTQTTKLLKLK